MCEQPFWGNLAVSLGVKSRIKSFPTYPILEGRVTGITQKNSKKCKQLLTYPVWEGNVIGNRRIFWPYQYELAGHAGQCLLRLGHVGQAGVPNSVTTASGYYHHHSLTLLY